MPQVTREIKRRLRSIKNTGQITRAMEMVATAKMRKAVANVLATRTYAGLAWDMLKEMVVRTDRNKHPLLTHRDKIKRVGMVIITSNRGLCGGFNHQISNRANLYITRHRAQDVEVEADLVAVGKRGRDIMWRHGHTVIAEFTKADITTRMDEVTPIAKLVIDDYLVGKYDKVVLAYTDFISAVTQKPRIKQLLPIEDEEMDVDLGAARSPIVPRHSPLDNKLGTRNEELGTYSYEYLFEPTPDEVLEDLLPRLIEVQLYQALLESDASEHSARMLAMHNASDAAQDMISGLTLTYNQARQSSITAELADITGGRVAVEA